jgi:hypothetical protein
MVCDIGMAPSAWFCGIIHSLDAAVLCAHAVHSMAHLGKVFIPMRNPNVFYTDSMEWGRRKFGTGFASF